MTLSELVGRDWVPVDPPKRADTDSTIARYDGEPIKVGFLIDRIEDTSDVFHSCYRSGKYDVQIKIDFDIGRGMINVTQAQGYENE